MRTLLFSLVFVLVAQGALAQAADEDVALPELRKELRERVEADQAVRKALLEKGMDNPDRQLLEKMRRIDSSNTARMKEIIEQHGWPGKDLVGADGSNAAFLIVQHADADFQKQALPLVKDAYDSGDLKGQSYALLLDRVLVQDGEKQVYGTQIEPVHLWEDGPEVYPIEDRSGVDERRAEVGLPPLDAYMDIIKQMYANQ